MIYRGDPESRSVTVQLPAAMFVEMDRLASNYSLPRSTFVRRLFRRLLLHPDWIVALMNEDDREPRPAKHPRPRVVHPLLGD